MPKTQVVSYTPLERVLVFKYPSWGALNTGEAARMAFEKRKSE